MPDTWVVSADCVNAAPKSEILISDPPAMRMLAGLISRCMTPWLDAYSRARAHL